MIFDFIKQLITQIGYEIVEYDLITEINYHDFIGEYGYKVDEVLFKIGDFGLNEQSAFIGFYNIRYDYIFLIAFIGLFVFYTSKLLMRLIVGRRNKGIAV